jgi:prevent-host-death family protein
MIGYQWTMTRTVAVSELKTHCLSLVERVARERCEFIVTKWGKPIARLAPIGKVHAAEALDRLRGTLVGGTHVEDFDTGLRWEAAPR